MFTLFVLLFTLFTAQCTQFTRFTLIPCPISPLVCSLDYGESGDNCDCFPEWVWWLVPLTSLLGVLMRINRIVQCDCLDNPLERLDYRFGIDVLRMCGPLMNSMKLVIPLHFI